MIIKLIILVYMALQTQSISYANDRAIADQGLEELSMMTGAANMQVIDIDADVSNVDDQPMSGLPLEYIHDTAISRHQVHFADPIATVYSIPNGNQHPLPFSRQSASINQEIIRIAMAAQISSRSRLMIQQDTSIEDIPSGFLSRQECNMLPDIIEAPRMDGIYNEPPHAPQLSDATPPNQYFHHIETFFIPAFIGVTQICLLSVFQRDPRYALTTAIADSVYLFYFFYQSCRVLYPIMTDPNHVVGDEALNTVFFIFSFKMYSFSTAYAWFYYIKKQEYSV